MDADHDGPMDGPGGPLSRRQVIGGVGGIAGAAVLGAALALPVAAQDGSAAGGSPQGRAATAGLVYLSMGSKDFLPEIFANGRISAAGGVYTNGFLSAGLQIPSGSLITEFQAGIRNATDGPATATLARVPLNESIGASVASVNVPVSAVSVALASTAVNHVVSADSSYAVRVFTTPDGNVRAYSARVGYIPAAAGLRFVTPTRVYDSRAGSPPNNVVKGPLSNGTRVVDCKNNGSGVPATALAVLATVTVVNTSAAGFLAIYENGIANPGTSTLNWWQSGSTIANTTVTAVDDLARCVAKVPANASADFIVDVLGYFV
jgi:hypothetical protein